MKRYQEFDLLRVVALGLILFCHFIRSLGFYQLDVPLGCVGNMVFFAMSGWLLGFTWESKNYPKYDIDFLKHRIFRLAIPLYLFSVPWMCYLKFSGASIGVKDVTLNLALLNWFDRLPGMTPFWFVTAICGFYFIVLFVSWLCRIRKHMPKSQLIVCGIIILLQLMLSLLKVRFGYILILVLCGLLCFYNASFIYTKIKRMPFVCVIIAAILAVLLLLVFWYCVWSGNIVVGTPLCYWVSIPIAICIAIVVFNIPVLGGMGWPIKFISGISYEVFLVHASMLILMKSFAGSIFNYFWMFIISTFCGAIVLNYFSRLVFKIVWSGK